MYVKTADGTKIDVIDLDFYCKCPVCGREVAVPEFFEFLESGDFDPYDSRIYCDNCTRESQTFRQILSAHVPESQLDRAVMKAMENLHSGVTV